MTHYFLLPTHPILTSGESHFPQELFQLIFSPAQHGSHEPNSEPDLSFRLAFSLLFIRPMFQLKITPLCSLSSPEFYHPFVFAPIVFQMMY